MKVLCSYSWMLCKHNSSGGNSREANSFLTSCQRVGGYGVTSAWCSLSTTRSGHFQMDVPFIFVKWIYKIKSGSRWKWISRMHSCAEMEMISETLDAWAGEASQRPSAVLAIVCVPGRQCVSFYRSPTFYYSNKRCIVLVLWTRERQRAWKDFAIICLRIYGLVTLQIDSSSEPHFPDRRPKGWTPPPPPSFVSV